ncbi:hypothetical protein K8R32_00670 [bacterium]|nr:hypothetical protein [bacterium]
MLRKLIIVIFISTLFISCGNNGSQKKDQAVVETENTVVDPIVITVAEFTDKAGELVGELVVIEGTVDHVCAHGGKRMFIIDEATDGRVKIVTGKNMPSFNTEMEGSEIKIIGTVDELVINEEYLTSWENEILSETEETKKVHEGTGSGEHKGGSHGDKADQGEHVKELEKIKQYREKIKNSDNDQFSFYSIICEKFKVKKAPKTE